MSEKLSKVIEPQVIFESTLLDERKKVGILGGTFNPPHLGHLIIADQVKNQLGLEKILFLPSAEPPHAQGKKTIDAKHRVKMVEQTIAERPDFEIELSEIQRGGKSYTYDTIRRLTEENPEIDYYFIIGADMVENLPTWYKVEELINLIQFVAVNRPSYSVETDYPLIFIDVPNIEISSSLVRQKLMDHCSVNYLIPDSVIQYIEKEGLYDIET